MPTNGFTILESIVKDTRVLVNKRRKECPISDLEGFPLFKRPCYSLLESLQSKPFSIIAEAKKASPSQGVIRPNFDPVDITTSYQRAGAAAVSILTEPKHFQGEIGYLSACRPSLSIPILRKDFIVDPYQLIEAKAFGADAVLLIATILSKTEIAELQDAAAQLGLSVLLEVYAESELERVDLDKTPIIGANSRDLNTFEVDLNHAQRVLSTLPGGCFRIAESGIRSGEDLLWLKQHGIHGALIGESFMREPDPGLALTSFISSIS